MRAFLYYYFHSFVNQIKKLFKSWILIFFIAFFGIMMFIGVLASTFEASEKKQASTEITTTVDEQAMSDSVDSITTRVGVANMVELVMGAIVFMIFALNIASAKKNTGKLFLPADVNLLFSSPIRPQSVVLFRIGTTIGTNMFLILILLFQLPNLIFNVGLSIWAAFAAILAYVIANILSTFLQLLVYLLSIKYRTFRKLFTPGLVVILALISGGFLMYQMNNGLDTIEAAIGYFNSDFSRFIPFWGWLKAFVRTAMDGNTTGTLLFSVLILAGSAILIWFIYHLNADFYEDAMTKSEEVAELLDAMKSDRMNLRKRKKDRSDKLLRDGLQHGFGANIYFFKNMYNRKRFAHLGFLTKTMEFYLCIAVCFGLVFRTASDTSNPYALAIIFAFVTFFRSMGNVVAQDTKMDYFVMIPESAMKKICFSYLAELLSTAIDLAIPLIVGSLIMGGNPLINLCCIIPILSINTYSASIGTFIDVTVPKNAGTNLKQIVQLMFVYFGLVPDLIVIAIFAFFKQVFLGIVFGTVFNFLLGLLFFFLASQFLEPHGGSRARNV